MVIITLMFNGESEELYVREILRKAAAYMSSCMHVISMMRRGNICIYSIALIYL